MPHRREINLANEKLARQEERTELLENQLEHLQQAIKECQIRLGEHSLQLHETPQLRQRIDVADDEMRRQIARLDYALAKQEGILDHIEDFHNARKTAEYRAAFTQSNPLVSVCVATSNRPDLLIDRCLASLQKQTYQNLQIIVVGDHCLDSTPDRVAALQDDRITFINLPERGPYPLPGRDRWCAGGVTPINKALELCAGQFVTHLDDDDRYELDRIEIMVRAAQENQADICWHQYWFQREDGTWYILGNGKFEHGQIGTGSIFYHRYLLRIPLDLYSYRLEEPMDWNRFRKMKALRPRKHFVEKPLIYHYYGSQSEPFVAQEGERFLE